VAVLQSAVLRVDSGIIDTPSPEGIASA